jgi:hypothetical protein
MPPELGDDDGEDAEYEQPMDPNAEYERACGADGRGQGLGS